LSDPRDAASLRPRLTHVFWLGGPPDAGKTTVATRLAERHRLHLYVFDRHNAEHHARLDPARQPAMAAFDAMTMDERWVLRSPDEMARTIVASWTESFWMTVEDVLALPTDPPVLVEGPGLFPECVAPLLTDRRRAMWLLPTDEFKRASAARRDKPSIRHETSDPERATASWLARDLLLGAHVRREAEQRGLPLLEVDGTRSVEETADLLEARFGLDGVAC
jgi:hypothetical protein